MYPRITVMNKFTATASAAIIAFLILSLAAPYLVPQARGDKPPGPLAFKFNLIGHPNWSNANINDDSNGRAIHIPLTTSWTPDPCDTEGGALVQTQDIDKGVKLWITHSTDGQFHILDRDATDDANASISAPT